MKRRQFIAMLGGAGAASCVSWPRPARTQRLAKLPTIGFLGANASVWTQWTAAFAERLRALGWTEGHTVAIDYRWSEGRPERIAEIAAEFVRLKVDVIVTNETSATTLLANGEVTCVHGIIAQEDGA